MKRILIAGANSYIGNSLEKYIKENYQDTYIVDTVDMINGYWRNKSFAGYDSVVHVAGIAHKKETNKNAPLYYSVNRDLAIETAKKAKSEGVKQFVFLSSMSVYGMDTGVITKETLPKPKSHYGCSKWEAEQGIAALENENFKVCILRPPMIYGKGCKGNFNSICWLLKTLPIFPYVQNERSMLYVTNLCSFVKLCVDNVLSGVYFPQNRRYVSTIQMARGIAGAMGKSIFFDHITGVIVCFLGLFCSTAKKAFGSLIYQNTEDFNFSYVVIENEQSFVDSII